MWAVLGLAIPTGLLARDPLGAAPADGRASRRYAMQASVSLVLVVTDVLIWAMSGGGYLLADLPVRRAGRRARRCTARVPAAGPALAPGPRRRADPDAERRARRPGVASCGGSSATCTTARRRGWSRSACSSGAPRSGSPTTPRARRSSARPVRRRPRRSRELRDLARGIAPPVLADRGLVAAVESLASRSTANVEVSRSSSTTGRRRWSRPPPTSWSPSR